MNRCLLLDVSGIIDEETFHEYMHTKLNFPGYYGFNLDAFWDCITDPDQSTMPQTLTIEGLAALNGFLPDLHDGFVKCLEEYVKLYPEREVVLRQNSPSGNGLEFEED